MNQLKLQIVGLIAGLAALFSLDRLNQSSFDVAATPTTVHLIAAGFVLLLLVTRLSKMISSVVAVSGVAILYAVSLAFADVSQFGGASALLLGLQIGIASAVVLTAIRVAKGLHEFEEAVANITLGEQTGVVSLAEARNDIAIEMSRARRHERPLTVTVLSYDPDDVHTSLHQMVRDVQERMMQRYIMSGLARVAAQTTRRGDIVVEDTASNRVIVLSPESTPDQLDALTHRLHDSAFRTMGIPVRFGVAGFPETALTFEDLVATASGEVEEARNPRGLPQTPAPVSTAFGTDTAAFPAVRSLYRDIDDVASTHLGEPSHAIHGD